MRVGDGGAQAGARKPPPKTYDVSFDTLPGFEDIRTQRLVGEALGLTNPYYRTHSARAGAVSRLEGREIVNFASYDYLGLNGHPEITAAVSNAASAWGTSVSASRLTAGERPAHRALEQELAAIYEAEDALAFVSGHATPLTVMSTLLGSRDLILFDSLMHNCVTLGAQFSGATRRSFPHNDLEALEAALARDRDRYGRALIVSEGLFSMDGDGPDLRRLLDLKDRYGCWLMIDDAHGLGVLGSRGRGIAEHAGLDPKRVDIWFGTLSKTLVSCGGYIAGSAALVEYLKYMAAGMVYSVGMPVPVAEASRTALAIMRREPHRVSRLQANSRALCDRASEAGLNVGASWGAGIVPIIVGEGIKTVMLAERLLARGVNAFPVLPPGVPERSARLRFFLSAAHTEAHIDLAVSALIEEAMALRLIRH